jgi:hypothetical protein
LDQLAKHQIVQGRQVWTNSDRSRLFTWDALHGEIEVFDKRGYHIGALDAVNGALIKGAVRGRRLYG